MAGFILHDMNLLTLPEAHMRDVRGNRVSMIFQEPMTSLNPLFSVGDQISEMFLRHLGSQQKRGLGSIRGNAGKCSNPLAIKTGQRNIRTSFPVGCGSAS